MEILQNRLLKYINSPCGWITCDEMTCTAVIEVYKYLTHLITENNFYLMILPVFSAREKRIQCNMYIKNSSAFFCKIW